MTVISLLFLCLSVGLGLPSPTRVSCFMFDLAARSYKCFTEELPQDYAVAGNFKALPGYSQFVDFRITDPRGAYVHSDSGKDNSDFRFTTALAGDYHFCIYNRLVQGVKYNEDLYRTVSLDLRLGPDATDYDDLATREHLKPLEVELRIMEDTIRAINTEYAYFKRREAEMRNTSEHLNSRSAWVTFLSVAFVIAFAWWQIRHMKGFLRSKRLID